MRSKEENGRKTGSKSKKVCKGKSGISGIKEENWALAQLLSTPKGPIA
jgi:hypothetical protein